MARVTELAVNGTRRRLDVDEERSLLSALRDDLDLTGAKYGCGEGQCGACIVLVNGQPMPSCITSVASIVGKEITTIEGLGTGTDQRQSTVGESEAPQTLEVNEQLHPLQEAFLEMNALQCGYCTPGMIMAAVALLHDNPQPGESEITHALKSNICRCGAYPRIVAAVRRAAELMQEQLQQEETLSEVMARGKGS
jgi:aerobic-type carbon monoxide dehydrogenase small subunit (CoxS/CutS family)